MERKLTICCFLALMVTFCFAQKKCCFPDAYEAFVEQSIAQLGVYKPSLTTTTVEMAFDSTNKRRAYLITLHYGGAVMHETKIYDYKNGYYYDADMEAGFCNRIPLPGAILNCIPASATYEGSYYAGDHKLTEDVFKFYITEPTDFGNMTLAVSVPNCIPIRSVFTGQYNGVPTLLKSVYLNFTKGISKPAKYFTIPRFCPKPL